VVVTGGSGFIGTNLVEYLIHRGDAVLSLDSASPKNPAHAPHWKSCDLLDRDALIRLVANFDPTHLVHLAARTDLMGKTLSDYVANTDGVRHIIDAVRKATGIKRTIYASSRMVCPIGYQPKDEFDTNPPNAYGESKVVGEKIVRAEAPASSWVIVRPTSIWGPWFGVPYRLFFDAIRSNKYFNPGHHNPRKSFGYVGNTVYQLDKLLDAPDQDVDHATLYLCDYPPLQLRSWAELIRAEFHVRAIRTVPHSLLLIVARIGDLLGRFGIQAPLTSFRLNNLITDMVHDTTRLEKICGPLPHAIERGVQETVAWMSRERAECGS
jgi:nucleoside-diphosphate-sugar epimerase